jgi:hypothetical protein
LHATAILFGSVQPNGGNRLLERQDTDVSSPSPATSIQAPDDVATGALERLVDELDDCIAELRRARRRAEALLDERRSGRQWLEIVSTESRPLVVESISTVLGSLARAGHEWRREEASALRDENVSINRIAALFGVTRQRISALLREQS